MKKPTKAAKATAGEKALHSKLQDQKITTNFGTSSAGTGWRPVCKGRYVGDQCFKRESEAQKYGARTLEALKNRVESSTPKRRSVKK